ncbi:MAG: radical SAM protein [Candidatus Eiseniibacteriota bacterium]|nr:MAG: radical SAM protein [Candidatus Eisenbacteria bacterium]
MQNEKQRSQKATAGQAERFVPRLIAWEITRSCVLSCSHCRASAQREPYEGELTTEECMRVLDEIALVSTPILILTGGEALLRDDVYDIARRANELGMRTVLASCGTVIDEESARRMVEAGVRRVSISLDGASSASHDSFRGESGAFDGALRGIEFLKRAGMEFQINTTVTRRNLGELKDILELAVELGACAFHPFLLVPTGRGKELAEEELSPAQYETVLTWVYEESGRTPLDFKPTCAPHYHRILGQKGTPEKKSEQLHSLTRGCMGGSSFCFISHVGDVQMCGFLDISAGNVKNDSFDKIWRESPFFLSLRDFERYHGTCGYCEFRKVCGGCRARSFAMTGEYLAEEPFCDYTPSEAAERRTSARRPGSARK